MRALASVVSAELFKMARKRRFYLVAGLLWLVVPGLLLLVGWLLQTRVAGTFVDDGTSVRQMVEAVASPFGIARGGFLLFGNLSPSLLIIVVALLSTLLVGEERSHNMWKTVLVAEPNRIAVICGKVVAGMIALALLMLGGFLAGPVFGSAGMAFLPTTYAGDWSGLLGLYAVQWLFGLAALLFGFLVVWWVRSQPVAVVLIFFLPALLEGAYSLYRTVVGFERLNPINALLQTLELRSTFEELPRYFFTTNLYAPSREPLADLGGAFGDEVQLGVAGVADMLSADVSRAAVVMGVYAFLFGAVLLWSFVKRDIV